MICSVQWYLCYVCHWPLVLITFDTKVCSNPATVRVHILSLFGNVAICKIVSHCTIPAYFKVIYDDIFMTTLTILWQP